MRLMQIEAMVIWNMKYQQINDKRMMLKNACHYFMLSGPKRFIATSLRRPLVLNTIGQL